MASSSSGEEANMTAFDNVSATIPEETVEEVAGSGKQDDHTAAPNSPAAVEDATTSTQYDEDDGNSDNADVDVDVDEDEDEVPLLKYARIRGAMSSAATVSDAVTSQSSSSPSLAAATNTTINSPCTSAQLGRIRLPRGEDATVTSPESSSIGPVLFTGHEDGSLHFIHMETGDAMVDSKQLLVKSVNNSTTKGDDLAIIDVSLDASANYLTAINGAGTCAIWEVKYGSSAYNALEPTTLATATSSPGQQPPESANPFANFLTSLAGQPVPSMNTSYNNSGNGSGNDHNTSGASSQSKTTVQVSRIHYSSSSFGGGRPTCMVMDPSYKRRREKALLVGFSNGRLVLTKRSFFLQRRTDVVIYQGSVGPMEAVTWRGALVAWADASGIKLFDVESMSRIAHVDRPTGARPSLYPTISSLRPNLCFETSDNLLMAWGDCVMQMHITETIVGDRQQQQGSSNVATTATTDESFGPARPTEMGSTTIVKRRQLECTMAWELDCVACGVAPLDKDHLVVLGLVPTNTDEDDLSTEKNPTQPNDVELQIISRSAGSVTYADAIPVNRPESAKSNHPSIEGMPTAIVPESANAYRLLSSFSIPRMEDPVEAEEEGFTAEQQDFDFNLFSSDSNNTVNFMDSHLQWSLDSVDFDASRGAEEAGDEMEDDDSDDYGFVLRKTSTGKHDNSTACATAPIMMVGAPADLVAVRTRDVDDSVSHALSLNKVGLALQRALRHKRQLRKHDMNNLVDAFLRAVLCIHGCEESNNGGAAEQHQKLSIRRLELAAKSTPVLLGGSVHRWEHWINEFARIPGALFVMWDQIPVRDPKLPPELYGELLNSLFSEIETMLASAEDDDTSKKPSPDVIAQAVERFIGALSAWGPTHALREKVSFYRFFVEQQSKKFQSNASIGSDSLAKLEGAWQRRLTQSATGYLELPSSTSSVPAQSALARNNAATSSTIVDSSSDSLFPIVELSSIISSRVSIISGIQGNQSKGLSPTLMNSEVALAALAELSIMAINYRMALRCYLVIGSRFSVEPLDEVENKAVSFVNNAGSEDCEAGVTRPYDFLIAMVEQHHLHGDLLELDLLSSQNNEAELSPPLISLVRLLGLDLVGDFLVEHCVPPPGRVYYNSVASGASSVDSIGSDVSRSTRDGDETLPINYVAEQFRSSPALLHWYLHLIFKRKPEMYVHFPTTAVPPRAVTELHRRHLVLYIDFAEDKDSSLSLLGTEVYNQERKTTPLLLFLKAALPLGGIQADEVRRLIESKRSEGGQDGMDFPHSFALELAYVVEDYGDGSEEDAQYVLDLYLRGAKSVMLAASYAQRNTEHATALWETLIQYCLAGGKPEEFDVLEEQKVDGTLFGSLLEAAALCGADLALLVTSIPPGMNIEGLRPRLVAAVADYRMKLTMHEAAADSCGKDRITLLRELGHRSRRGMRHSSAPSSRMGLPPTNIQPKAELSPVVDDGNLGVILSRPVQRPNRYRLSVQLPMR